MSLQNVDEQQDDITNLEEQCDIDNGYIPIGQLIYHNYKLPETYFSEKCLITSLSAQGVAKATFTKEPLLLT